MNFPALLQLLDYSPDEHVAICRNQPAAPFRSAVVRSAEALAHVETLPDCDIWFGVNPTAGPARENAGRGTADDVTRLAALWCDLDVKPGACADIGTAWSIIDAIAGLLHEQPSAIVHSGHGLQPYWPLEDGHITDEASRGRAEMLVTRFGRLVKLVAEQHGAKADSVFDLPRILRVPNTMNHKGDPVEVTYTVGTGAPMTLDSLAERLDEAGVAERNDDDSTDIVSAPDGWQYAGLTCGYVHTMVKGWSADNPMARHPWLLAQATRIACAHRNGCFTDEDAHRAALSALERRFVELCARAGDARPVKLFEVADAVRYGVRLAACKTDDGLARELGRHSHFDQRAGVSDTVSDTAMKQAATAPVIPIRSITLDAAHKVFCKWLGNDYDTDALDAALAAAAVERLDGDPLWLLIISGSGNAKTETVQAFDGIEAIIVSSISSEAALLSATPKRERAKNATGGLLRKVGDRGVLVIKDVTSILSMDRNTRGQVLAALREIYDGRWSREVGAEGGRIIDWAGRIAVVGAVTTAWDTAHAVICLDGRPFRAGPHRLPQRHATAPGAERSATPATRRPCAPSWPPRWPG